MWPKVKASHHVSSAYDVGEAHGANEASLRPCRRQLVGEEWALDVRYEGSQSQRV